MSEIVKTVSRIFAPLIIVFGIYVTLHGHLTPGGGFAGGLIIAGAVVLLVLAYGGEREKLEGEKKSTSRLESSGILLFWLVAVLGLVVGGIFFLNIMGKGLPFTIFSAGIIPVCNIAIAVEVGGAISTILLALVLFEKDEN
ncbi:hypothetical protein CH333_02940 [candidate division WOR-3 bacterium JGI_Cruoil_03_44_89]|uniref:Na+/H+ antiporter MnhB subunit-related protein domain-containing protein n=1 Tax=candidate division WOR-3 bacterium JGI_Cruoil_03_44_89 TaxID=1973748 RepID=A0A235BW43_UNCW3|nr:MAG: hypothetical protein CH333_02940 [candidate division WOR-3 bacterium JGI_Cruoil_03_44_89]